MPAIKEIREKAGYAEYTSFHHWLIHEIGFYLTKVFLHLPFTPNQITIFWMVFQLLSTFIVLKGTYWYILLGTFLFQFGYILDTIDGQVARMRNQKSLSGIYLDGLAHNLGNPLFLIFLSYGVSVREDNIVYLLFGIVGAISYWYNKILAINPFWFKEKDRTLINKYFTYSMRKPARWNDFLRIQCPFNLLFFGVLLGFSHYMVIVYSLIFSADLVRKLVYILRIFKKVDQEFMEKG